MPGANHGSKLALTLCRVDCSVPKWTKSATSGIGFRCEKSGLFVGRNGVCYVAGNTCNMQGLSDPALAITASGQ